MTNKADERTAAGNGTFAIGGVSYSADSLVQAESFVLHIKFSGKNPAHRKATKPSDCSKTIKIYYIKL
jgi:hypothetical protein